MPHYFINVDQTNNPGLHHEVHLRGCQHGDQIAWNKQFDLGSHINEKCAVATAKVIYPDADGCQACCPQAHKG